MPGIGRSRKVRHANPFVIGRRHASFFSPRLNRRISNIVNSEALVAVAIQITAACIWNWNK
jgi:hypothetical protein